MGTTPCPLSALLDPLTLFRHPLWLHGGTPPGSVTDPAREHYTRALQYLSLGAGEQAVKELNDAVKLDPTNAEFHKCWRLRITMRDGINLP